MEAGRIVAFFEQKRILCAVCLEVKGNRAHLLSEENREVTLGLNRIVQTSSYSLPNALPRESLVENLKSIVERQKDLMPSISIQELWELIWEERRDFGLRELAELTFSTEITFDHEMALFRALFEDRLYFKPKGNLYEPREKERVEEIILQLAREAEQARELQEAGQWLARVWAGEAVQPPTKKEEIVSLLKELAVYGDEAPDHAKAKALLQEAKIGLPGAAFELLVRMGVWSEDENLFLHRHQISQTFPPKVLTEVEEILSHSLNGVPAHPQDVDLTFLHPLTIDSEFTRDIDDALSLERVEEGYQVGIHITDVATFLNGRNEIFQEAMSRAISIYLPDQRIPMIPPSLSEGTCSLIVGEKRRALSFLVRLDKEGKVLEYKIVPSIIQVERRLSYEQVDHLLEEMDEEMTILGRIAYKLS